jgi:hypothetical protein
MPRSTGLSGQPLERPFANLRLAMSADIRSLDTSSRILDLVSISLDFLARKCTPITLISKVKDKGYLAYINPAIDKSISRPINEALFEPDNARISDAWQSWVRGEPISISELARLLYTVEIAPCAVSDLFNRANVKGPATYFEYLVGHLFAQEFGVIPKKKATIPIGTRAVRLTMDFLFELGQDQPHIHLPVKLSTRERVVQAWAHQRILDDAYGPGAYRGILVVGSETKLDSKTHEVVEICVPEQWLAYQTHLATMDRIYYFDPPSTYVELARQFEIIRLKQIAEFFAEKEEVLSRPLA